MTTNAEADSSASASAGLDFIRTIVAEDVRTGRYGGRVATRFPPEPNGYLHIGHAKSICLNFGIAGDYAGGVCHLRFDDTNPTTESVEYAESIQRDVRWLGFDWGENLFFASDYFDQLYAYAEQLIRDGNAYVDSLNEEEIRAYRGTVTEPGRHSPYRIRTVEENLDLFRRMRAGEFADGAHVLRAKIDMASPNMKMRDPLLYRIRHAHHFRTGNRWCIYPMYDFAHPLSDAIEQITHSICTLEFENNRDVYDWLLDNTQRPPRPYQYEFARLNLDYTVMSKRKLLRLVEGGFVAGWDDPRMLTLAGLRRRGVTASAIRAFCDRIGVAKANSRVDMAALEYSIRDDLNQVAPRVMCVLRPLRVVLENYPEGETEWLAAPYFPYDVPKEGSRQVPFSRVLYIEQDDFQEDPPRGFYRLAPGREVRLRYGYLVTCVGVVKDPETGAVVELRCTYDPATRGGDTPDGRRVQGTLHWVSAAHALPAEVRLYDRLFRTANPDEGSDEGDFLTCLNPVSKELLSGSRIEPSVAADPAGTRYQFERQGYFWPDPVDSSPQRLVFNRIVELRDSWARQVENDGAGRSVQAAPRPQAPAASVMAATPELPLSAAGERLVAEYELPTDDARILGDDPAVTAFFEQALAVHGDARAVANWITNALLRELKERPVTQLPFAGPQLGALVALVADGTLSTTLAKEVLAVMLAEGGEPREIVAQRGMAQVSDVAALLTIVDHVIAAHAEKAAQYRAGKSGLLGFFMGQVMKVTQGKANPQLVQELVQQQLEG